MRLQGKVVAMTNFDFLKKNKEFKSFADQAIEAEKGLTISTSTVAILARRALELAVRWLYVTDPDLILPYRDNLSSLVHEPSFQATIEPKLFPLIKYIIKLGNVAVHTNQKIKRDDAVLALRNLFEFCKWIEYCYSVEYEDAIYDETLLEHGGEKRETAKELRELAERLNSKDQKLEELRQANQQLQAQMQALRDQNINARIFTVDEISERETRERYIDIQLMEAGWQIGKDCLIEVEVKGMPSAVGIGYADYVLYGENGKPLAVVEAKKTGVDPMAGSQQAKLYADCLEKQYGQRPLIFLANGFEILFIDEVGGYPKRQVSGFFTKEELQLNIDRRKLKKSLKRIEISDEITNRPYQKEAITAICEAIEQKHRKMLIVQATGSGKTRVSISLVDVLRRHNHVKNILFLADRIALVKQAKKNYSNLLPDLTICNLSDTNDDPEQSRMIFSTYPTMMNAIDDTKRKDGRKLFTPGHFDLIIIDESHRSIYKKYQDIFNYFDAMLLGMTATPKNDVDKNTYDVFQLEHGVPTYAYELNQAVEEGYLVNYSTREYKTKIMEEGIHYEDLSDEDKEQFENTFEDDELIGKDISNNAINTWLFNADTIDIVLKELMEHGLKVEGGDKLGKTIIFAKNSRHAEIIVERFNQLYPEYGAGFIKQIDYSIRYVDSLIDDFGTKEKEPQIAVSVDMLDTGIDVPEILNLVFFKKIRSYAKFWQMIGRGTRLCKDLFAPGEDKEKFLIFDYCNNFEFFRVNTNGEESGNTQALTEKIFNCKVQIARELQSAEYRNDEDYIEYRNQLIEGLHDSVQRLNNDSFRVKQRLKYVEFYRQKESWTNLESKHTSELKEYIAPIITPQKEDELARRFDHLMYSIQLADLQSRNASRNKKIVTSTAEQLSNKCGIPQVAEQKYIIDQVLHREFWEKATIFDMDAVREALRDLLKFLDTEFHQIYYVNVEDCITDVVEGEAIDQTAGLQGYKEKVEYYLKEHRDTMAVFKLRQNKKLNENDLEELERVLWQELGTKEDYHRQYGQTPIGRLVRTIVGVDRDAVNAAFSEFISDEHLNQRQIHFVKLMIDYIVHNGNIESNSVFLEEPFKTAGAITVLFKDRLDTASKLLKIADEIRKNSEEIA